MPILDGRSLHLGQLSGMNDSMEFRWLESVASVATGRFVSNIHEISTDRRVVNVLLEFFYQLGKETASLRREAHCVCFSSKWDVLSQWRAYADDGAGFAIGFSRKWLESQGGLRLAEVCYDTRLHVDLVTDELKRCSRYAITLSQNDEQFAEKAATEFFKRIASDSIYCKNPKFDEEKEWRLYYALDVDPQADPPTPLLKQGYRARGSELTHYLILSFKENPKAVRTIALGPRNPALENPVALHQFLATSGYGHVRIVGSEATYR